VTSNDFGDIDAATEPEASADSTPGHRPSRGRAGAAWFRRHGRIARGLVVIAVAAIVGTAYVVGGPPIAFGQTASLDARTAAGPADIQFGAQSKSLGTQTLGVGPAGDTTGAASGTNSGISPEAYPQPTPRAPSWPPPSQTRSSRPDSSISWSATSTPP
jgi:hypothetical protein